MQFAIKWLERGPKIAKRQKYVEREIIHLSQFRHPLVVEFKGIMMTPSHLGILLEYAEVSVA